MRCYRKGCAIVSSIIMLQETPGVTSQLARRQPLGHIITKCIDKHVIEPKLEDLNRIKDFVGPGR